MNAGADWAHPEWALPLLLSFIVLAVACGLAVRRARRAQQRLLGEVPGAGGLRDAALLFALLALCIALLGPRFGTHTVRIPATGVDLVLLMDVSRSMDAEDVPPSRAVRARQTAERLLGGLSAGDRVALAVFAGSGSLLTPLTHDKQALVELLPALNSGLMSDTGSRLWKSLEAILPAFDQDPLRPRLLLILSDGERAHVAPEDAFAPLADAGVRAVSVAIGSDAGGPIPTANGFVLDARGRTVQSQRETRGLETIAERTGGAVLLADAWGAVDPDALLAELRAGARPAGDGFIERELPVTRTALPAGLALAMLLLEALAWRPGNLLRAARRFVPRPSPGATARAATAALALLALGASHTGLETRVRRRPNDAAALLALGIARAREGQPLEAERAFLAAAVRADDPSLVALAYYDLGVSSLERGELERAHAAFLDALAVDPNDAQARFNLEWTVRELARRQEPPPGGSENPQLGEVPPEEPEASDTEPEDPTEELAQEDSAPEETESEKDEADLDETPIGNSLPPSVPPLSPDAAEHWLENVTDDAGRGLQRKAEEGEPAKSKGPTW